MDFHGTLCVKVLYIKLKEAEVMGLDFPRC